MRESSLEENMKKHIRFWIAIGLVLGSAALPVMANDARGLDFGLYLLLTRGMTEGQVLSVAGKPDLRADQGYTNSGRDALAVKTYTYMPTEANPETTTITFVGGLVRDIRRDKMF